MRALTIPLLLAVAPLPGRADLRLSLSLDSRAGPPVSLLSPDEPRVPSAHLLPPLATERGLPLLDLEARAGTMTGDMTRGEREVLAFVLGIIPGFGVGHLVAGSRAWPVWLVVDAILFVFVGWGFWWGGPLWDGLGGLGALIFIVERGFEGYFAYRAAGGKPFAAAEPVPGGGPLASAPAFPERRCSLVALTF